MRGGNGFYRYNEQASPGPKHYLVTGLDGVRRFGRLVVERDQTGIAKLLRGATTHAETTCFQKQIETHTENGLFVFSTDGLQPEPNRKGGMDPAS